MKMTDLRIGLKTYPEEAIGWSGGVYYPRKETITNEINSLHGTGLSVDEGLNTLTHNEKDLSEIGDDKSKERSNILNKYISKEDGLLKILSKMWTETEVTGFGIFPYVNSVFFSLRTGLKDGEWTVTFSNPHDKAMRVNCYADEVLMIRDEEIAPGSDRKISFTVCSIHEDTHLQFFVSDSATCIDDADNKYLYIKDIDYKELPKKAQGDKPFIFLASDSTVQTYEKFYYPQTGWGQVFHKYFCPDEALCECMSDDKVYPQCHVYEKNSIAIENRSIGARSSRSFIDEGKWNALLLRARPGDYCFIQWAHNDATAVRPNRFVCPEDFDGFLMKYIDSCKSRGIYPVLVTPVSRRNCDDNNGDFPMSFKEYRDVMLEVGKRENVPVVDLCLMSNEYMKKVGGEEAKNLHLWCPAGAYPDGAYADGVSDNTHLQEYGALVYARMVAGALLDMKGFKEIDRLKPLINLGSEPQKKVIHAIPKPVNKEVPSGFSLQELNIENKIANFLLIWNDVEGATSYNVYRKGSVDFQFFPLRSVSSKEKKSEAVLPFMLPAADVYQVKVTAVFEDGRESEPSRIIEFRA